MELGEDIKLCTRCSMDDGVVIMRSELAAYRELRRLVWDEDDMDGAIQLIKHMQVLGYEGWGD